VHNARLQNGDRNAASGWCNNVVVVAHSQAHSIRIKL
jgi:hypothetical protein